MRFATCEQSDSSIIQQVEHPTDVPPAVGCFQEGSRNFPELLQRLPP